MNVNLNVQVLVQIAEFAAYQNAIQILIVFNAVMKKKIHTTMSWTTMIIGMKLL